MVIRQKSIDKNSFEAGKPANFILLDAQDAYEAIRERAEVLASIRNGQYLFKRAPRRNEVEIDFLKEKELV